jgi:transposase-like protein
MKKKNNKTFAKDGLSPKGNAYNFYSYALKRKVVDQIMKGILTKEEALIRYGIRSRQSINYWIKKYSSLNYRINKDYGMKESPEEKIKRLEAENEELKEEKIILNIAIDIADEQLNTQIRKKYLPQQLEKFKKHKSYKGGKK